MARSLGPDPGKPSQKPAICSENFRRVAGRSARTSGPYREWEWEPGVSIEQNLLLKLTPRSLWA